MALQVDTLKRKFTIQKNGKDIDLADPNPEMSPQEVIKFYSSEYPELTNASVSGPKVEGTKAVYSFKTSVGTKG
jgi:PRTRC genetic system protein C